jgi:hypothetical protein
MPELAKPSAQVAPTVSAKLVTIEPESKELIATTFLEVTTTPAPQKQRYTKVQLEQQKAAVEKQIATLEARVVTLDEQLELFEA